MPARGIRRRQAAVARLRAEVLVRRLGHGLVVPFQPRDAVLHALLGPTEAHEVRVHAVAAELPVVDAR
eukprot:1886300-Alexandrium_andersonii.AAC.1